MNVFYTNDCPKIAASEHCIVHRNKMIVEYAQLLSTAHHVLGVNALDVYKLTHKNHPSAVWVRQSSAHYNWLVDCALELCRLYYKDTGKVHKSYKVLVNLIALPLRMKNNGFKRPPVAAPESFKFAAIFHGVCFAYQAYLNYKYHQWMLKDKPIYVKWAWSAPKWYKTIK